MTTARTTILSKPTQTWYCSSSCTSTCREKGKLTVRDERAFGFSSGCCRKRAREGEEGQGTGCSRFPFNLLCASERLGGQSLCAQVSVRHTCTHLQRSSAGPGGQEPSYEEVELCKRHGERVGMSAGLAGAGGGSS